MNKKQIREFLDRLAGEEGCNFRGKGKNIKWNCENNYNSAKKILTAMKISKKEQNNFLEKCEEYGGYCDCEILLNAEDYLLKLK